MSPRKIAVDLLSAAFGLGSWIAMTGLWVELPVLTHRLPEGWALASQLALYLQVANVGPVAYGLFHHWWRSWATERAANHLQLAVGAVATFLLIFMWSWTVKGMSVSFFFLSFCLSLVDCTSSVTFLPFMANFRAVYLTPYLLGEGLSGLIPSLVATAQGVESPECVNRTSFSEDLGRNVTEVVPYIREPRFEPEWFFAILLMMELLSWLAFVLLDKLPLCQSEKVKNTSKKDSFEMQCIGNSQEKKKTNRSTSLYLYLLFLQGWASIATFGIFPAIQPYSSLPYGDTAFHLVVTLCGVAYPVSCFAAIFWEVRSVCAISWMTVFATAVSLYAAATAVLSPRPPLVHTETGSVLIVVCWVTFMFTFSYIKTMATILLGDYWGHRALFWCGAVTQGGALAGALAMFLLVNVFHFFQDEAACLV